MPASPETSDRSLPCSELPPLEILLAQPRGFCAGVDRAIQVVEAALTKFGAPVYVRHEIVHNPFVVNELRQKGAVFVDEVDQVPEDYPVIFSAHGVAKSVPAAAQARNLIAVDATCPLVSRVHREAERYHRQGCHVVLIGHAGHPEVIGTLGQLPEGTMSLVETRADAEALTLDPHAPLAYTTQTTLSVDDTRDIITVLKRRFPQLIEPRKEDICYATSNRQNAVKALARQSDAMMVVGAPNSSNSRRLVEVAQANGCPQAVLVRSAEDIDWNWFDGVRILGLSAGASAPDHLVIGVIEACRARFRVTAHEVVHCQEQVQFSLPHILRD